jgi:hypothetical protein
MTSCLTQQQVYGSPDGLYWVSTGTPILVYCDMALKATICSTTQGSYSGVTRDASKLAYTMTTQLSSTGTCTIWNLRRTSDGYPLDLLSVAYGNTLNVCQALGFRNFISVTPCSFGAGTGYTKCGYALASYYRYGNGCSGCTMNDGFFAYYVLQGPMSSATVATDATGTKNLLCGTL